MSLGIRNEMWATADQSNKTWYSRKPLAEHNHGCRPADVEVREGGRPEMATLSRNKQRCPSTSAPGAINVQRVWERKKDRERGGRERKRKRDFSTLATSACVNSPTLFCFRNLQSTQFIINGNHVRARAFHVSNSSFKPFL